MKRIAIATLISLAIPLLCLAQQTNKPPVMVTRTFDVLPTITEKIYTAAVEAGWETEQGMVFVTAGEKSSQEHTDWKEFFRGMGVEWPEGSSIRYVPSVGKIVVTNTEKNMRKFEEVIVTLNVMPSQIEIEAQFVEYKLPDIEALAKQGGVTQQALMSLWHEGKAELLYAPKVVTQSGQEAIVKGVKEVIYPTELNLGSTNTMSVSTNSDSHIPGGFETREVGTILKVMPEMTPERWISLTMSPEVVEEPIWKTYKGTFSDKDGKQQQIEIEQPFFYTMSVTTSVSLKNGKTVMAGGGMMNRTNDKMVYCFVTARLVDLEGNPIKTPDSEPLKNEKK